MRDIKRGETESECGADDAGEDAPRGARARGAQALLGDGDRLRSFERGQHELALVGLQRVVLLEDHAVLAAQRIEFGGDRPGRPVNGVPSISASSICSSSSVSRFSVDASRSWRSVS